MGKWQTNMGWYTLFMLLHKLCHRNNVSECCCLQLTLYVNHPKLLNIHIK